MARLMVLLVLTARLLSADGCSGKEFECENGACIRKDKYCDGSTDCFDRSDEFCDCEANGHIRCARLGFCVAKDKICDGKNDCIFYEDETNCENCKGFQCDNGWCLPPGRKCDQFAECPGEEDEKSCSCVDGEHRCKENNRCILSRWVCDGIADCPSRTDEVNCRSTCKAPAIPCNIDQSSCIQPEQQCDGHRDCTDGSDEVDCVIVQPSGVLLVFERSDSKYLPVCYNSWINNPTFGSSVCSLTGAGTYKSSSYLDSAHVPEAGNGFFSLINETTGKSILQNVEKSSESCGMLVTVECAYDQCGAITSAVRLNKMNMSPMTFASTRTRPGLNLLTGSSLINAERAILGEYPWQVNLMYDGIPFCGGTLFDDSWVLTAAHCAAEDIDPTRYKVQLGSLLLEGETKQENQFMQEIPVADILVHPGWQKKKILNDVALLQLRWPAKQTDMVRSLCWRDDLTKVDIFKDFIECRTSGWGFVDRQATLLPWTLQSTRMSLISNKMCQSVFSDDFRADSMICAGTVTGIITICSGDSGSSLVCRSLENTWSLVGVASWSPAQVNGAECAGISVFSRLTTFLPWIKQALANPRAAKTFDPNPAAHHSACAELIASLLVSQVFLQLCLKY